MKIAAKRIIAVATVFLLVAGRARAQTFTPLHGFSYDDGGNISSGLILSSNSLYGAAYMGGANERGTLFKINTDGTGFTNIYSFTATSGLYSYTNGDGANPVGRLILSSNILYGTTAYGGGYGYGTVFAVKIDGAGFTNLHSFSLRSPSGGLALSGNTLYGTTPLGGSDEFGTVFAINTDGTGFTNLYSFSFKDGTNSDGASPNGDLILSGDKLYGTTSVSVGAYDGTILNNGTIFRINTDGTGFTNLYSFTAVDQVSGANSDGANPEAGLILSGNTLYGTASGGGSSGNGAVFAINTDGTAFTNLYSFSYNDGANPDAGLILSQNVLYGTTYNGGTNAQGTIFAVNVDGTGFTNLYNFSFSDGANPDADMVLSGSTLYGTTYSGGSGLFGTVFKLDLSGSSGPPSIPLSIQQKGDKVILSWTNPAFVLQSAHAVIGAYTNVLGATSPYTNAVSGSQLFFRLKAN